MGFFIKVHFYLGILCLKNLILNFVGICLFQLKSYSYHTSRYITHPKVKQGKGINPLSNRQLELPGDWRVTAHQGFVATSFCSPLRVLESSIVVVNERHFMENARKIKPEKEINYKEMLFKKH